MNCSSSEALFERFLDGDLAPAQRAALLAHVDICAACHSVLEELRVVDALLLEPREVPLAPNFTFATMAEVRALPNPRPRRTPVLAYLISYLTAMWLLAGAAFVLEPTATRAVGNTVLDLSGMAFSAFGGVGHAFVQLANHGGATAETVVGSVVLLDVFLALAFVAGLFYVRPRLAERLRS